MRIRSLATATALAVATVPFLTSSALSADTTVGDALVPTNVPSCNGVTFLLPVSSAPNYVVPSDGVITSWRTSTIAGGSAVSRTLKTARANADGTYTVVATSAPLALPANAAAQTLSQSVRIPAKAGDVLGFSSLGNDPCGTATNKAADQYIVVGGDPAAGAVVPNQGGSGYRFSVAATLEPDADGDGFGDTTQDRCATDAATQGVCPTPKDTTAPNTTITSAKAAKAKLAKAGKSGKSGKKKFKKARVTVTFASTEAGTFSCSVDGAAFTACSSPLTVKLKKGSHTIAVRATDAAGNTDATPATTTVKVKKAKKEK